MQTASTPAFGGGGGGLFGQTASKPFGSTLGSPSPFGGSSPSLFGASSGGSLFGAPASSAAFGGGGLFGAAPSSGSSLFSFAQPQNAPGTGIGQPQGALQLPGASLVESIFSLPCDGSNCACVAPIMWSADDMCWSHVNTCMHLSVRCILLSMRHPYVALYNVICWHDLDLIGLTKSSIECCHYIGGCLGCELSGVGKTFRAIQISILLTKISLAGVSSSPYGTLPPAPAAVEGGPQVAEYRAGISTRPFAGLASQRTLALLAPRNITPRTGVPLRPASSRARTRRYCWLSSTLELGCIFNGQSQR